MTPKTNEEGGPVDCMALKREAQAAIYEEIKDLSHAEEIAWFRRRAEEGPFGDWLKKVRRRSSGTLSSRR